MVTLRWPRRGRFRDRERDVTVQGPDGTVDVDDSDVVEQYLDRGFERVDDDQDGSDTASDGGGTPSEGAEPQGEDVEDGFDVGAFLDRTPVSDVADDIADGQADKHLAEIESEASRTTVQDAVDDRRQSLNDAGE